MAKGTAQAVSKVQQVDSELNSDVDTRRIVSMAELNQ